jgi:hypothetical protein
MASQDSLTLAQALLLAAGILGGGAALLAIWDYLRRLYRRTLGRRGDRYDRLARLGTGANLGFFTSVLGEPPAMQRTVAYDEYLEIVGREDPDFSPLADEYETQRRIVTVRFLVSLFVDRDYYVETVCDDDQTVLAFSVTTRGRRFRPLYRIHPKPSLIDRWKWRRRSGEPYRPLVELKLGKTTFADLDPPANSEFTGAKVRIEVGAHNHCYSEVTSYGNPGYYQWFAWSATDAARQGRLGRIVEAARDVPGGRWPQRPEDREQNPDLDPEPNWEEMTALHQFRRETAITTYTVVSGLLWEENYPLPRFGPHENEVRTLP